MGLFGEGFFVKIPPIHLLNNDICRISPKSAFSDQKWVAALGTSP